ncbi:aldehyde dehydrogenase [Burkholderia stagnalis]|uniref:thiamine pyrophosphate-dependent enzyme n=1 Tax=Burkholderia stagnalis TaxID=1503054 RepID=UPI00075FC5CF|nr:thiamine pyrophosphate-dependent enzyme [Burkholderia stagnalis]KWK49985.1 aldehyde dehydrogenase [Burkholderia stagnalis]KWK57767.1 aldehyde dehydrogenase [Burkholderia stagnalis]
MSQQNQNALIERRPFVSKLLADIPDALVVTGLGSPSYDVFAAGDRDENFYLWGAMGGSVALGLGLALAQPKKPVVVITGDGEALMGIGTLGTVGVKQPKNLTIVVLDNGHYGETGMQQSHSSLGTQLVAVSKGFGIADSFEMRNAEDVGQLVERINALKGTVLAQVHIGTDEPPRALPPRDGVFVKNRFRANLGFGPF